MNILVTLHTLWLTLTDRARTALTTRPEAGVTIEQVIWAVAAIGFATVVATVIRNYITTEAAKIP